MKHFNLSFSFSLLYFAVVATSFAATTNIDLNYNFNGIWNGPSEHMDLTNEEQGYRSISDRGLDFSSTGGLPTGGVFDSYVYRNEANVLDLVHVGDRETLKGWDPDPTDDFNRHGAEPLWLPGLESDQTTPQTTILGTPITLAGSSQASFLYHGSNSPEYLDVRLGFDDAGDDVVRRLHTIDWTNIDGAWEHAQDLGQSPAHAFAHQVGSTSGVFRSASDDPISPKNYDDPRADVNLQLTEGIVDLDSEVGRTLISITFENAFDMNPDGSNPKGYAIYAANVTTDDIAGFAGDFDGSGAVGDGDLTLLLANWGSAVPPVPAGWTGAQPTAPGIGDDELTALLSTWGQGPLSAASSVPEPTTAVLALLAGIACLGARRNG